MMKGMYLSEMVYVVYELPQTCVFCGSFCLCWQALPALPSFFFAANGSNVLVLVQSHIYCIFSKYSKLD